MSSKLSPDRIDVLRRIVEPFRFSYAIPETTSIRAMCREGESFADAKQRVSPFIDEMCAAGYLERAEYITCTQRYLDLENPERSRVITEPMEVLDCVELGCEQLQRPFAETPPSFAPQAFLLPTSRTHEFVDSQPLQFNGNDIRKVLMASEQENGKLVQKIRSGKKRRKSAAYDLGNAEDTVRCQCFNHLMYATQIARYAYHPRVQHWRNGDPAPHRLGAHAWYPADRRRVGVLYLGNLSPKALWVVTEILLRPEIRAITGGYDALELIW